MAHLINRIRKGLGIEEDDENFPDTFEDMNYAVGNTSGLAVGNVPVPMDRRIGSQSQIGGSLMEVQIYNPATFSVERDEVVNTIQQLDLDITLHCDPNMGFASAYKSQAPRGAAFEIVQRYFTRYIQELAIFKNFVNNREGTDFNIGRINPHASTSPLPATDERVPADVGLDPFGFIISETEESDREGSGKNIYDNEEFMKRFYHMFILHELDEPYQIYQLFARQSPKFRDQWQESQSKAADQFWNSINDENYPDPLEEKVRLIQYIPQRDRGIETAWFEVAEEKDVEALPTENGDVASLRNLIERIGTIPNLLYQIKTGNFGEDVDEDVLERLQEEVPELVEEALDELWLYEKDSVDFQISVEAKLGALQSTLDIQQAQIMERAQDIDEDELQKDAENVMMGKIGEGDEENYFEKDGAEDKEPEEKYDDFVESLLNNFQQAMWQESNLFYRIIPAWMVCADQEYDDHEEFYAPKFIWEAIIERRWSDEYDIDLTDPEKDNGYVDAIAESRQFRMDVAAASGACYIWGHFTQIEEDFKSKKGIEGGTYTWIEWMNKHGIGVNIETMEVNPNQLLKVWRPKDVVVTSRAINITSRRELEEINDELDECPAKFTVDMEHIAGSGIDPWEEMQRLIDQEEEIAKSSKFDRYNILTDKDKPLARIMRQYHLMKPGLEGRQGTRHGPIGRGDTDIYEWLYKLVEAGFTRNEGEPAAIMYEQGEEKRETIYVTRIAMDLIQRGVKPEDLTPEDIPLEGDYETTEQALKARFFGMDKAQFNSEMTKIEEHAFDPLDTLLEAESFDHTYSGKGYLDSGGRPGEWMGEEYQ